MRLACAQSDVTLKVHWGILYNTGPETTLSNGSYLPNTVTIPYIIELLNFSTLRGGSTTSGSLGYEIRQNPTKFVSVDMTTRSNPNFTAIDSNAFDGCPNLVSITLPVSVQSIGQYAFRLCTGLTSIILPENVTTIGQYAFSQCSNLDSIIIPESVTTIGQYAFSQCSNLTEIIIPEGVTRIEPYTFNRCTKLTSIILPESLDSIGNNAFASGVFVNITIPANVTKIEAEVFDWCSDLRSVTFEGTIDGANIANDLGSRSTDLRAKYLEGGPGTYTRTSSTGNWTKQE
jgi:hypothetical protein